MYGSKPKNVVVTVNVVVSVKKPRQETPQILKTVIDLKQHKQEETAFRFKKDGLGDLTKGSVSTLAWRFLRTPPRCVQLIKLSVMPAQVEFQRMRGGLDSRLRGNDVEKGLGNA